MKKKILKYNLFKSLLFVMIVLGCNNYLQASINIDSVRTTISRCPNNGSITLFVTTNQAPILYSIIAGPELRPLQSDPLFQGLLPGSYLISVSNIAGEKDTQTVVVKGSNYIEPDFAPTQKEPTCFGGNDGQIIGHPVLTNSRPPFTWVLTNTVTHVITTQSSDTFNDLKSATYTLRMYDSCQNFVTRTIFINNDDTIFKEDEQHRANINKIGCDSMRLGLYFYTSDQLYTGTYKLIMYHFNDTIIKIVTPRLTGTNYPFSGVNWYNIDDTFPDISYGADFRFILEDKCGQRIFSKEIKIPSFIFTVRVWYSDSSNCTGNLGAILDIYDNIYLSNQSYYLTPKYPLTMTVKDIASNTVVQTSSINSGLLNITPKVAGRNYLITITDACGDVYAFDTIWPVAGKPRVVTSPYYGCIDSTATTDIRIYGFGPKVKLEILSGPRYLHSSKPKYSYFDSIIYPKTYTGFKSVGFFVGNTFIVTNLSKELKNLPLGKYHFRVTDSCGNEIIDSFIVSTITTLNHAISFKKGCLGQNILYYKLNCTYSINKYISIRNIVTNQFIAYNINKFNDVFIDSITSIPSGKYEVTISYSTVASAVAINENIKDCWIVKDTVDIPIYERPKVNSFSIIYCNGNRYAELLPDSTKGIPPYQYEVITGPKLYPLQTSNVFDFIPVGNYTSRIIDACGNSNVMDFGVDTLIFPPITKIGSSCLNGSFMLFYNSSTYFTYHWTKPDGTIFIGDTLKVNGVTYADTGTYYITRYVNINNCKDSFITSYRLTSSAEYTNNKTICEGENVIIGNHTYTQSGNYTDTIPSSACDTFYTLNLIVLPKIKRNIDTTICAGSHVVIGNHFYFNAGIYSDTLTSSNGCDSIITLTLSVTQTIDLHITTSKTLVIPGDTIQLNAIAISNSPGILLFNWTTIASLDSNNIHNPIATINKPSWIYAEAYTTNGCINKDSVFIDIINDCKAENIFIPNSFSPNGDGVNDVFRVRSKTLQSGKLVVYNRWGNKVFESDDITKGWDGYYKGQPEQLEVYGYYFEGKCLNGETIILKGNVTLLR